MKIKLATLMAGPDGVHNAGTVVDLPTAEAKYLIQTHGAVAVEPEPEPEDNGSGEGETEPSKKRKGKNK